MREGKLMLEGVERKMGEDARRGGGARAWVRELVTLFLGRGKGGRGASCSLWLWSR